MKALVQQVSSSSLVFFRIAFGLVMLWETLRYFLYGWIAKYWILPKFFFTFEGFEWVQPWAGNGMYLHFFFLGVLAIFIALGLFYRISTILFFLGFTYIFLLDKVHYLNHFYLISLLSFLMIWLPANRYWSIDAALFPKIKSATIGIWTVWLLRFQLGVVYFFGGIAKINGDWLQGEPMRKWLAAKTNFPFLGQWFTEEWMVYLFSYGGLLLDLLIVPFLLWKRTRVFAFLGITTFHLLNAQLFSIGIFPWFMIAATTIFFAPDWLFRLLGIQTKKDAKPQVITQVKPPVLTWQHKCLFAFLGVYLVVQCLLPLRHFLYKGNVSWTEEGHRFAWHMKLRDKNAKAQFIIYDKDLCKRIKVNSKKYLSSRQRRKMSTRPDMIRQFAHHLAATYHKKGHENIEVYAEVRAKLNQHDYKKLINDQIDLSQIPFSWKKADWIVPFE